MSCQLAARRPRLGVVRGVQRLHASPNKKENVMWRVLVVAMGGLFWPMAAWACGEPPIKQPGDPWEKPPISAPSVKKTVLIEIKGKVVAYRCFLFGRRINLAITVGNETYWLDLRDNKRLAEVIAKAEHGVVISGELEEVNDKVEGKSHIVNVASVQAVQPEFAMFSACIPPGAILKGQLTDSGWMTIGGVTYWLDYGDRLDLRELAKKLKGRTV